MMPLQLCTEINIVHWSCVSVAWKFTAIGSMTCKRFTFIWSFLLLLVKYETYERAKVAISLGVCCMHIKGPRIGACDNTVTCR